MHYGMHSNMHLWHMPDIASIALLCVTLTWGGHILSLSPIRKHTGVFTAAQAAGST